MGSRIGDLPRAVDAPLIQMTLLGDIDVAYYADDTAAGRPLVLLHSINAAPSAMEMKPLFDYYRQSRPVYALDLPGFGQSQRGELGYSADWFARVIAAFLSGLPGEPPDVVALSLSAEFLARAVVEHDARCHRLVLVSPTGLSARQPPGAETSERISRVLSLPLLPAGLFRGLTSYPSIRYFLGQAFHGAPPEELVDYAWRTARQPGASAGPFAFLSMRLFSGDALDALYGKLRTPTLVLYDEDPNIDFERLPELLAANPAVGAQRIPGTLGLPHWEKPELTFSTLDGFLV